MSEQNKINKAFTESIDAAEALTLVAFNGLDSLREAMPVSSYSRIAELSLYFEKAWTEDRVLSIEDCLWLVEPEDREELLERLLEIDISMGLKHNSNVSKDDYYERFPKWKSLINQVYDSLSTLSITGYGRLGLTIGHYTIQDVLGKGAMGIVYKAWDEHLQRPVAIKYLLPQHNRQVDQEKMAELFRREVALLGQLKRDSMFAQAHESSKDGDFLYLVMEFVDGVDLAKYVQNNGGKIDPLEAISYIRQIAKGLQEIHEMGIIHRDIKPENAVRDQEGNIRILDLGLGLLKDSPIIKDDPVSTETTQKRLFLLDSATGRNMAESDQNKIAGTPAYWAPEAYYAPEMVDAKSDLFSLGGTFFYLLTGILPIKWRNPIEKKKKKHLPLKDFFEKENLKFPQDIFDILEKMLELDPPKRFQSAEELIQALDKLSAKLTPKTWRQKWRIPLLCSAGILTLFITFSTVHFLGLRQVNQKLDEARALAESDSNAALNLLNDMDPEDFSLTRKKDFYDLRARLFEETKKFASAQNDLEKLMELEPENSSHLIRWASLALSMEEKDKERARQKIIHAIKNDPWNIPLNILDAQFIFNNAINKGLSNENEKKQEFLLEVIDILGEVLTPTDQSETPCAQDKTEALYLRAKAYLEHGNSDFAIGDVEKILDMDNNSGKVPPKVWFLMADIRFHLKNWKEAVDCWEHVKDPKVLDKLDKEVKKGVFFKRAQCHFHLGEFDKCVDYCRLAAPNNNETYPPMLHKFRGEAAFYIEDWGTACRDLRKLTDDFAENFSRNEQNQFRTMLAYALFQRGLDQKMNEASSEKTDKVPSKDTFEACIRYIKPITDIDDFILIITNKDEKEEWLTPKLIMLNAKVELDPDDTEAKDEYFNEKTRIGTLQQEKKKPEPEGNPEDKPEDKPESKPEGKPEGKQPLPVSRSPGSIR